MRRVLRLVLVCGLGCALIGAQELPDEITSDTVIATKNDEVKELKGYIVRNNYQLVEIRKSAEEKTGLKIPQSAVNYVFYVSANNKAYIEALQDYKERKYSGALESFTEAGKSLKNFKVGKQGEEFAQYINYYSAMCYFHLGNYAQAQKFFDLALQPRNAIFKFEGEYYLGRSLEAQGKYSEAESKYGLLVSAVFPQMLEQAQWGKRWDYLCRLGQIRAQLLSDAQKSGQENNIKSLLAKFNALIKEGGDYVDEGVRSDALMLQASALKYLARSNAGDYKKVIELLRKPVLEAVAENNRRVLSWMYLDMADSYWGMMQAQKNSAAKKKQAGEAFFEYLRLAMVYDLPPAQMCRVYYRVGYLFEQLRGREWKKRAIMYYKRAASFKYKQYQPYVSAKEALQRLQN